MGSEISSYLKQSYLCWDALKKTDLQRKRDVCFQEYTPLGKSALKGNSSNSRISVPHLIFKVMSFNILSQTHLVHHINYYRNCPRECLDWNFRRGLLSDEFNAENADILCLQEVDESHKIDVLKPFREKGFDAIYVPRGEDKPDGCAMVYRTSMFQVEDVSAVHYKRPEIPLMDRPNVGIVARLAIRAHPGHSVVVANTHILYNPRKDDIKMGQVQMFLTEVERLAYNPKGYPQRYHPVILTGEFNAKPKSNVINMIRQKPLNIQSEKQVGVADLLKKYLNISESCQYLDVLESRKRGMEDPRKTKDLQAVLQQLRVDDDLDSPYEADVVSQNNTVGTPVRSKVEEYKSYQGNNKNSSSPRNHVYHVFQFENVYFNFSLDDKIPTNNEERKLGAGDYMFYSVNRKGKLVPGELQLLSRLRMPTLAEYKSKFRFLPNYASGSDQLPLIASFILPVY